VWRPKKRRSCNRKSNRVCRNGIVNAMPLNLRVSLSLNERHLEGMEARECVSIKTVNRNAGSCSFLISSSHGTRTAWFSFNHARISRWSFADAFDMHRTQSQGHALHPVPRALVRVPTAEPRGARSPPPPSTYTCPTVSRSREPTAASRGARPPPHTRT
jgi:hypothetical protein